VVLLVSFVFVAGMAASAPAKKAGGSSRSREIVARLQKKYEATGTLKARFEQENHLRSLGRTTRSKGRFLMSKPGRIRVEYLEPENQLVVSNGEKFWIYTERLNQVIVSDIGGPGSVPLLFLAGKGNLTQEFHVELEDEGVPERKEGVWKAAQPYRLSLIPKQANAGFQKMWIEVDPETFQITGLDYVDALRNMTQIRFFDIEEGAAIGAGSFQFKIPSGVEVLRAPSPGKR
jgi:outer membrane lipoprotein carrier protein